MSYCIDHPAAFRGHGTARRVLAERVSSFTDDTSYFRELIYTCLRILPSTPGDRQIPLDQLFLNDLPPADLALLVYWRLASGMHTDIRHVDFELLQLRCLRELLRLLLRLVHVVQVGQSGRGGDRRVRQTLSGELERALDDLSFVSRGNWV